MDAHALCLIVQSHLKIQRNNMGIGFLDNLENSIDLDKLQLESKPIVEIDNMGREKFWEDLGRPSDDGE